MKEGLEISLLELLRVLLKKAWLIILAALIGSLIFWGCTVNFVEPQYKASITMYVNSNSNQEGNYLSSSDLSVAVRLVNTYINIIESDRVLEKVVAETGAQLEHNALRKMIYAAAVNETEMFEVTVTSGDAQLSADLANAIAKVSPEVISQIIKGSSAEIIDYAKVPQTYISPNYTQSAILGFLIGALLAVAAIVIAHMLDVRIKSEEDLTGLFSVPVLGSIPDVIEIVKHSKDERSWWK